MCLGIPMKVLSIDGDTMVAEVDGVRREGSLALLSDAVVAGDYVIVHAGFAIARLDEEEARETLALMQRVFEETGPA